MKKRGITFLEMLSMELKGDGEVAPGRGLPARAAAPRLPVGSAARAPAI